MTQEELKEIVNYDPTTGVFTVKKAWCRSSPIGHVLGTINTGGYRQIRIKRKSWYGHQLAWLYVYGYVPKMLDHVNQDRKDNRIANLRETTKSLNGINRKLNSNNTSGYPGAFRFRNKWLASIKKDNIQRHLGYYDTPEEAHAAYLKAREELFPGV